MSGAGRSQHSQHEANGSHRDALCKDSFRGAAKNIWTPQLTGTPEISGSFRGASRDCDRGSDFHLRIEIQIN